VLIDARRFDGDGLEAKVCIVGSGMGGASVAKKLIEAGIDVLFVEPGGDGPSRVPPPIRHQSVGQSFGLPVTRAFELGGSTNLWHGICGALDPIDFEDRDWIADSGWPISYDDLAPYYAEARHWLGIAAAPTTAAPRQSVAMQEVLAPKTFSTSRTPARMKEVVLGWIMAGRARCLMRAVALEFRLDADGIVRSLVVGCGDRRIAVKAEAFIASAGGLETPRLLLNSARGSRRILGSGGPLVGRYLMDHPTGYFSQVVFHKLQKSQFGSAALMGVGNIVGLALRPALQRRFRLPNHYAFIRPGAGPAKVPNDLLRSFLGVRGVAGLSPQHVVAILTSPYIMRRVLRERLGVSAATRFGDIYVMAEQAPNPDSRVILSDEIRDRFGYPTAQVDWRLRRGEWDHFDRYFSLVADGLRRDEKIASLRIDPAEEWPQVLSSAAHHLGTARTAATASHGVVDANLRVFGRSNLFVCDGSVFPTAGGTNPTFTISALAFRLGEHLARTLRAPAFAHSAASVHPGPSP
jgi:choline dehydrogenase-like flavoprotein